MALKFWICRLCNYLWGDIFDFYLLWWNHLTFKYLLSQAGKICFILSFNVEKDSYFRFKLHQDFICRYFFQSVRISVEYCLATYFLRRIQVDTFQKVTFDNLFFETSSISIQIIRVMHRVIYVCSNSHDFLAVFALAHSNQSNCIIFEW